MLVISGVKNRCPVVVHNGVIKLGLSEEKLTGAALVAGRVAAPELQPGRQSLKSLDENQHVPIGVTPAQLD